MKARSTVYQGNVLHGYTTSTAKHCAEQGCEDAKRLEQKMKERLEWSDTRILRAIIVLLDRQNWYA